MVGRGTGWRSPTELCILPLAERHHHVTMSRAKAPAVLETTRDAAWDAVVALERESGQRLYGYALRLGVDSGRAADLVQSAGGFVHRPYRHLGPGTRRRDASRLAPHEQTPAASRDYERAAHRSMTWPDQLNWTVRFRLKSTVFVVVPMNRYNVPVVMRPPNGLTSPGTNVVTL